MAEKPLGRVRELFEAAMNLPVERRKSFLQKECRGDEQLLAEVEDLLAADTDSSSCIGWPLEVKGGESVISGGETSSRIIDGQPMALSPGTKLGPYEIVGLLGVGGMGEVYRARDSRLKRDVAIKVLPEAFARNDDRIARFQREAEMLASVSHAHIGTIFDMTTAEGIQFLVLELVEGPTLADRINRGPIPLEEALRIAGQIAEALETAHEKRVVHRDLKPDNIKIAPDGNVKVLDFGLARLYESEDADKGSSSRSPTISSEPGMIVGTAAYMSPEQAKGQQAHRSSDVWAFGCVLYEMLTAEALFRRESAGETLAEVLKTEPDWSKLPAETPEALRRLMRRCLQKDRTLRLRDIGDARLELQDAQSERVSGSEKPAMRMGRREWLLATSGAAVAGVGGLWLGSRGHSDAPIVDGGEIRVGYYASITRKDSSYGHSTRMGFETAKEDQDRAGNLLNRGITLVPADDTGDKEVAARVVRSLIEEDRVVALLGEFKTSLSEAAAIVAQDAKIPMISHGATHPGVTKFGDYIFRVCFTDTFQGAAMAQFASKTGFRRIAILHERGKYSEFLASTFGQDFENEHEGRKIVAIERYDSKDTEFKDSLIKLQAKRPDAVFVPGYYTEVAMIARQKKEIGLDVPLLGADGWDTPQLLESAGEELEGSYYSTHFFALQPTENVEGFVAKFKERNERLPDAVAALAFDAARVLFHAIGKAQSADPRRIRDAIAMTKDFQGVTGNITLLNQAERNPPKPAVILKIEGGKSTYQDTI